ncbi:unnamed protein product [Chilo suppressalis]|uniref:Major facilitator superfamily (MFS) profile domain-containing protein n=1 Tax=Chilo suppressalis TaxID=168631 RepID=A0ABN8B1V6_CHISP|nr:unnamed protein product [Chilo suppressalis]
MAAGTEDRGGTHSGVPNEGQVHAPVERNVEEVQSPVNINAEQVQPIVNQNPEQVQHIVKQIPEQVQPTVKHDTEQVQPPVNHDEEQVQPPRNTEQIQFTLDRNATQVGPPRDLPPRIPDAEHALPGRVPGPEQTPLPRVPKPEQGLPSRVPQPERTRPSEQAASENQGDALEAALAQLGPFGLYQRYMVVMLCIPNMLAAMYSLNFIFVADQVPFRCVVPECEGLWPKYSSDITSTLVPNGTRCERFEPLHPTNQTCLREHFGQDRIQCHQFAYQNYDTIFAEFDLGCREYLRTLVGTVRNSALPFALILTGYVSDKFGRRTAFCIFSAFAGVLGILKGFSVNYEMYVTTEFFEAMLGYGFNSAGYVLIVELARPSLRAAFACATGVAYGMGGVLFALIAWGVGNWRRLLWTIHSAALLLPLYWLLVDESPRWLQAQGKRDRAAAIIRKAAMINKKPINEELMKALDQESKKEETVKSNAWLQLLRSKVLIFRFLTCCWCWIAVAFVYYGLTINSVALSGDKYVNFALNMAMEVVASLLIMMALERFGRKWSIFVAFLVCGAACVTPFFVSNTGAGLGLFFLGKLSITFAFNSLYVYTAELFPTSTRSSALAACSLVGRIGSVLAPQTPLLSMYVQALLYGACSLSAALVVLCAPETRRAALPQHARDAERLAPPPPVPPPAPPAPPRRPVLSADL